MYTVVELSVINIDKHAEARNISNSVVQATEDGEIEDSDPIRILTESVREE